MGFGAFRGFGAFADFAADFGAFSDFGAVVGVEAFPEAVADSGPAPFVVAIQVGYDRRTAR